MNELSRKQRKNINYNINIMLHDTRKKCTELISQLIKFLDPSDCI